MTLFSFVSLHYTSILFISTHIYIYMYIDRYPFPFVWLIMYIEEYTIDIMNAEARNEMTVYFKFLLNQLHYYEWHLTWSILYVLLELLIFKCLYLLRNEYHDTINIHTWSPNNVLIQRWEPVAFSDKHLLFILFPCINKLYSIQKIYTPLYMAYFSSLG